MYQFEDEAPCIHHRSQFDTIPAPPAFDDEPEPVSETRVLAFPGGEVFIPKPTRAELVLSAQQWSRALRDHAVDWNAHTDKARGMFDRLDAVLAELAEST